MTGELSTLGSRLVTRLRAPIRRAHHKESLMVRKRAATPVGRVACGNAARAFFVALYQRPTGAVAFLLRLSGA